MDDRVLAEQNCDVGVVGLDLPVIPHAEVVHEPGWFLVSVVVIHAAGWDGNVLKCLTWRSVSTTGSLIELSADESDVWVDGLDTIVEVWEAVVVSGAEEVFVTDLDEFDVKRSWVTVSGTHGTVSSVGTTHAKL